jgi:G8 domain
MNFIIGLLLSVGLTLFPHAALRDVSAAEGPVSFQTHHDTIPNFAYNPTIRSAQNGSWFSTSTWNPARLPGAGDVVLIRHVVTYDTTTGTADTIGIDAGGVLTFRSDRVTKLTVGTLQVMPGGTLEVGTASSPIAANVTAEIIIRNKALDLTNDGVGVYDPEQWGTGLMVIDGTVTMHGAPKTPTYVCLGTEPRAGHTSLTLAQSVSGWNVGDRLSLPDTRHLKAGSGEVWSGYVPQWEELAMAGISGNAITLTSALRFDHLGARNADNGLEFLPHVANLSRNVTIRSESPSGTRGHVAFLEKAAVDLRYVAFQSLGRTTNADLGSSNHAGRYALHIHHVRGPANPQNTGYQFRLIGNALSESTKWPLTIHDSHYGLIQQNVVYRGTGAGIVTEDGNESYNELVGNFAMAIEGTANPRNNDGRDGSVFWFTGFNHRLRNNVAANGIGKHQGLVAGSGYNFWWPAGSSMNTRIPLYRGADIIGGLAGREYRLVNMQLTPILEFSGNEAYGAMATGMTIWHLGTDGYTSHATMAETVIKDFTGWHLWEEAFYGYPINRVTLDGFVVRGSSRAFGTFDYGTAWQAGDYWAENVTIRRANIQGMQSGICCSTNTPGTFKIENSYFRTYSTAMTIDTLATPGTGANIPPRKTEVRNTTFVAWPGQPLRSITMNWRTDRANTDTQEKDEMFVYTYQGNANDHFRVYYTEQATQNIAGGLAPCNATRPEIDGLVCPLSGSSTDTMPPAPPSGLQVAN